MAIDRIETGVAYELDADAPTHDVEPRPAQPGARRGLAVASARTVFRVILALIGILVVLPAAIAAQASIGI